MAESSISDKKRKRHSDGTPKPRKKSAPSDQSDTTIKVIHHEQDERFIPVVASTPGLSIPTTTTFSTYRKPATKSTSSDELLLHSTTHPTLNYTAREASSDLLTHHIGIYDAQSKELHLLPARHMSIRSTLRSEEEAVRKDKIAKRTDKELTGAQSLQYEFGTKKAKKAIASLSENAITPKKERPTSPSAARKALKDDPTAASVLESMAESAESAPDREAMQAAVDAAKPRPPHNPAATTVKEVYTTDDVVGGSMMVALKVKSWADDVYKGVDVWTASSFVSRRIKEIVEANDVVRLKVAKYVLVLVQFAKTLRRTKEGGIAAGRVPKREVLREELGGVDEWVIGEVVKRFSSGGEISKWQVDNLLAHILVSVLIVDEFETDLTDICEDLKLTVKDVSKYFREVGATVDSLTDTQRIRMGLSKAEAEKHRIAKLPVPPKFPKQRKIPRKGR